MALAHGLDERDAMKLTVALAFVALNYYVYAIFASQEIIPQHERFESFPSEIGSWVCPRFQAMPDDVLERLGATDWVICNYGSEERQSSVGVYIGYHESQVRDYDDGDRVTSIHPPEHCIPGSGWDLIDTRVVAFRSGDASSGLVGEAKRFVIAKGEQRSLVYFWYQSRGRVIARNTDVILYKFLDRALKSRSDGSLVRLTTPIIRGDEEAAEREIMTFAKAMTPLLPGFLPN